MCIYVRFLKYKRGTAVRLDGITMVIWALPFAEIQAEGGAPDGGAPLVFQQTTNIAHYYSTDMSLSVDKIMSSRNHCAKSLGEMKHVQLPNHSL